MEENTIHSRASQTAHNSTVSHFSPEIRMMSIKCCWNVLEKVVEKAAAAEGDLCGCG